MSAFDAERRKADDRRRWENLILLTPPFRGPDRPAGILPSTRSAPQGVSLTEPLALEVLAQLRTDQLGMPAGDLLLLRRTTLTLVRGDRRDLTAYQLATTPMVYTRPSRHTVRELAAALNIAQATVTRALDDPEHTHLACRRRDPTHRRSVLIGRTPAAERLLCEAGAGMVAAARDVVEATIEDVVADAPRRPSSRTTGANALR